MLFLIDLDRMAAVRARPRERPRPRERDGRQRRRAADPDGTSGRGDQARDGCGMRVIYMCCAWLVNDLRVCDGLPYLLPYSPYADGMERGRSEGVAEAAGRRGTGASGPQGGGRGGAARGGHI
jgi:hypothetical protein